MSSTAEQTRALIAEAQGGKKEALEQLSRENFPLVKSLVKRFLNRGAEYDDLIQVGNIGLIKAIQNFDLKFTVRFSTYAVPMILGELKRFLRDNNTVKMPRSLKEMQQRVRLAYNEFCQNNGREPTVGELTDLLHEPQEEVLLALESLNGCLSLDEPLHDENVTLGELLEDKPHGASLCDAMALRQCIDQLVEKEKTVILLRYYKSMTQSRIARILGISQVQVSRIESKAIEKMRRKLSAS